MFALKCSSCILYITYPIMLTNITITFACQPANFSSKMSWIFPQLFVSVVGCSLWDSLRLWVWVSYSSKAVHKMLNLILEKECHLVETFGNESSVEVSLVQSFWICLINADCWMTFVQIYSVEFLKNARGKCNAGYGTVDESHSVPILKILENIYFISTFPDDVNVN